MMVLGFKAKVLIDIRGGVSEWFSGQGDGRTQMDG
jgi:hypothetical protein